MDEAATTGENTKKMNITKKITTLNYVPLEEPLTSADVQAFKRNNRRPVSALQKSAAVFVVAAVLFTVAIIGMMSRGRELSLIVSALIFLVTAFFVVFIAWSKARVRLRYHARLYKFAMANKLSVGFDRPLMAAATDSPDGMIFGLGHSQRFMERIELSPRAELSNFTFVTGSGKSRREYYWGYARFKLPRRIPNMVLDATANNQWFMSNLSVKFKRSQRLSLEGNFDAYFSLYAPEQYERDALYIFTPDVMAVLVDYGKDFDFELVEDELFIYAKGSFKLDQPATYKNLAVMAETIYDKIEGRSEKYADERVGDRAANVVAPGGRRLKRQFSWLLIIVGIIWVYSIVIHPILKAMFNW